MVTLKQGTPGGEIREICVFAGFWAVLIASTRSRVPGATRCWFNSTILLYRAGRRRNLVAFGGVSLGAYTAPRACASHLSNTAEIGSIWRGWIAHFSFQ